MKYFTSEKTNDLLLIRLSKKGRFWDRLITLLAALGLSLVAAWILHSQLNLIEHKELQFGIIFFIVFVLLTLFISIKRYNSLRVDKKKDIFIVNGSIVLERTNPMRIYRREIISAEGSGISAIKLSYLNRKFDLLRGVGDKDAMEIMGLLIDFFELEP